MKDCVMCDGFYGTADLLVWRSENNGFTYGFNDYPKVDNFDNFHSLHGDYLRLDGEWNPGFRVGLGWNTGYDFWDLFLNYTWFYGDADESTHRGDLAQVAAQPLGVVFGGILPLNPVGAGNNFANPAFINANANWNVHLNVGDLELGRGQYSTMHIAVRPYWGVRAAWIDQEFKDHFSTPVVLNAASLFTEIKDSNKSLYWGVGPRVGLNSEWHVSRCYNLSVIGKASGALLYGKERMQHITKLHLVEGGDEGFFTNEKIHDAYWQLVPTMQVQLGFQWATCFNCDKMYFHLNVCWEANYWWDQYNNPSALGCPNCRTGSNVSIPQPNDRITALTMEGLTFNAEFDF